MKKSKRVKKSKGVTYELTVKGLLSLKFTESTVQAILDDIELYMRRQNKNAIILNDGRFSFETVVMTYDKSSI